MNIMMFIAMQFLIGVITGGLLITQVIKIMIDRGKAPKFLTNRADKLIPILQKSLKGGNKPEAAGSVPAIEVKAKNIKI